jgi:hypothetical protein
MGCGWHVPSLRFGAVCDGEGCICTLVMRECVSRVKGELEIALLRCRCRNQFFCQTFPKTDPRISVVKVKMWASG